MIPLFLRMLLKRGTGTRKGGASTRNDKMKKWEQNREDVMKLLYTKALESIDAH